MKTQWLQGLCNYRVPGIARAYLEYGNIIVLDNSQNGQNGNFSNLHISNAWISFFFPPCFILLPHSSISALSPIPPASHALLKRSNRSDPAHLHSGSRWAWETGCMIWIEMYWFYVRSTAIYMPLARVSLGIRYAHKRFTSLFFWWHCGAVQLALGYIGMQRPHSNTMVEVDG